VTDRPEAPRRRMRNARWTRADLVALDFETTGLDPARDEIVSFGTVAIRGGRIQMSSSDYRLTRPEMPPSPVSVTIHGLRTQDLAAAPALAETRLALANALRRRFLLTWFAPLENGFLRAIFGGSRRTWERRNIDVRLLAIAAAEDPEGAARWSLSTAARVHGVPVVDAHHALDDALVTAQLFLVLATKRVVDGPARVADLLRASGARAGR
jgi:DNA polymerase III subunit epsilon